ncbi:winged helix-turn-helix transcriptional regulator [Undibacterium sp. TJN19]|uniref:winged helix-turn-helix transcriptional regulator n=1 Tax=Undibacterium sp. TJN19 TaxID=3413055 RepID=UPI003BF3690C
MKSTLKSILLVDASEEMRPVSAALEEAGFAISHTSLDRVINASQTSTPAAMMFSMLGRLDTPGIRNLLRSPKMPHGIASIAMIRSDLLPTFDFSIGFDDFIVYPAPSDEVSARTRRAIFIKSGVESDNTLQAGDLRIDLGNCKVFICGKEIDLTYTEYELLRFMATNRDKVFTREVFLNRVWGYDFYGGVRTVDVHIRRLRSKIEDNEHTFIETVHNVGYRFHINEQTPPPVIKPVTPTINLSAF